MRDKTGKIVAIENAKLKLLKVLSSNNNALCDEYKLFLQHLTLKTWNFWIFSAKCDKILRFRWFSFIMPKRRGELHHYSVLHK